ncbi:dirigent protein 23-like [Cucurbita pepo subsp. pepo]|uniref:dirigent protein 23-like n=1 Tax=Cucurbita pepo subsp. pepo TaxID=3664 RepID=UPI000C9D4083|nr:dirigent protein 23-like [Cucurbita pepo subsp. pepo]
MATLSNSLFLVLLLAALRWTPTLNAKKPLISRHDSQKQTVTNIQFYFHDTPSGNTPSAIKVAEAPSSTNSPTLFGNVFIADDPLTETPDPKSKEVGRAQGLYAMASQQELALLMTLTYQFTAGEFNGSSIVIVGKNSVMHKVRELPVVGGTGVFRFARGYALASTYSFNTVGDAIVGYNVTVIH